MTRELGASVRNGVARPHRGGSRGLVAISLLCASLAVREAGAQNIYGGSYVCPPPAPTVIDVWWSPDGLAAAQYDVDRFRQAAMRVVAAWNEESRTGRRFRFRGTPPPGTTSLPGAIWIRNGAADEYWCQCSGTPGASELLAAASIAGASCSAMSSATICMRLNFCQTEGAIPWNEMVGTPSQYSYEAVLLHEMGHAGMSFPDENVQHGIMNGSFTVGPLAPRLHLYPIDQRSAFVHSSLAEVRAASLVRYDWNTIAWGTPDASLGVLSSVGPGVASYNFPPFRPYIEAATLGAVFPTTRNGSYGGGWQVRGPTGISGVGTQTLWPRVAVSDYGEVMMTWLQCQEPGFTFANMCGCAYAYSSTPSNQTSWQTGYVRAAVGTLSSDTGRTTFAPCAVEYNSIRDEFVVAYLHAEALAPYTAFTPAEGGSFNLSLAVDARAGSPFATLRYMGDLAFGRWGSTNGLTDGVLTAAAAVGTGNRENAIVQMRVIWTGSHYETQAAYNASGAEEAFRTGRHFGTTSFGYGGDAMLFWSDLDSDLSLRAAWASGMHSPFVIEPVSGGYPTNLTSSVSANADMDIPDGRFVVGYSQD